MSADRKTDVWMPLWIGADGRRRNWATFDPVHANPDRLPRVAGVYAIYFDNELVYVGQSNDIGARLTRHAIKFGYDSNIHTPWGSIPDSVKVTAKVKRSRVLGDWAMWEIRLIHKLKPRFNCTYLERRSA
jgi:excinuclease UvrABC nuclease subunit